MHGLQGLDVSPGPSLAEASPSGKPAAEPAHVAVLARQAALSSGASEAAAEAVKVSVSAVEDAAKSAALRGGANAADASAAAKMVAELMNGLPLSDALEGAARASAAGALHHVLNAASGGRAALADLATDVQAHGSKQGEVANPRLGSQHLTEASTAATGAATGAATAAQIPDRQDSSLDTMNENLDSVMGVADAAKAAALARGASDESAAAAGKRAASAALQVAAAARAEALASGSGLQAATAAAAKAVAAVSDPIVEQAHDLAFSSGRDAFGAPIDAYEATVGICKGGAKWAHGFDKECSAGKVSGQKCKEVCNENFECRAWDMYKDKCCLNKKGSTGDGTIGHKCMVKKQAVFDADVRMSKARALASSAEGKRALAMLVPCLATRASLGTSNPCELGQQAYDDVGCGCGGQDPLADWLVNTLADLQSKSGKGREQGVLGKVAALRASSLSAACLTPCPTPCPIPCATPCPTLCPTPIPTSIPTPLPTHPVTPIPTPHPTSLPTASQMAYLTSLPPAPEAVPQQQQL
jgi:hypothetical protein